MSRPRIRTRSQVLLSKRYARTTGLCKPDIELSLINNPNGDHEFLGGPISERIVPNPIKKLTTGDLKDVFFLGQIFAN